MTRQVLALQIEISSAWSLFKDRAACGVQRGLAESNKSATTIALQSHIINKAICVFFFLLHFFFVHSKNKGANRNTKQNCKDSKKKSVSENN